MNQNSTERYFLVLVRDIIARGKVTGENHWRNSISDIMKNPCITYTDDFNPVDKNNIIRLIETKASNGDESFEGNFTFNPKDLFIGIDDSPKEKFIGDVNFRNKVNLENRRFQYHIVFNLINGYTTLVHFTIGEKRLKKVSIEKILGDDRFLAVHDIRYILPTQSTLQYEKVIDEYLESCLFNKMNFSPRGVINLDKVENYKLINEIPDELKLNPNTKLWEFVNKKRF